MPVTDLVIIVPGILGSRLEKNGQEIWGTSPKRLLSNLFTFGKVLKSGLRIPHDVDPSDPQDGVKPTALIGGLTVIPGLIAMDSYDRLRSNLVSDLELQTGQLLDFPYDWRLSSRINGAFLREFISKRLEAYRHQSGRRDATAILICHSMGGLVAEWCVNLDSTDISKIVTIGTPHRGSMLALDAIVNGVRLPRRFGADLTEMTLSFPSIYELLPTYSCVEHRGLPLKSLSDAELLQDIVSSSSTSYEDLSQRVTTGLKFHTDLQAMRSRNANDWEGICFRGTEQPTMLSGILTATGLQCQESISGIDRGGDGVVPDDSAVPPYWTRVGAAKTARGRHSTMPGGRSLRVELRVALRNSGRLLSPFVPIAIRFPPEIPTGQRLEIEVFPRGDDRTTPKLSLKTTLVSEDNRNRGAISRPAIRSGDRYLSSFDDLPPGLYRLIVQRGDGRARAIEEVSDALLVYEDVQDHP